MKRSVKLLVIFSTILLVVLFASCTTPDRADKAHDVTMTGERSAGTGADTTPNGGASGSSTSERTTSGEYAAVTHIVDGDTIDVTFASGAVKRVRYIGIDTPERYEDLYREATAANARLVSGRQVRLVKDVSETDRYGRLLRYVYVDGTFVNAELVKQGYAAAATYPPDVKYAEYFRKLAAEARGKGVGLWAPDGARAPPSMSEPANTPQAPEDAESPGSYIGNKNSKKFHLPSCYALPAPHNRVYFTSRDEAVAQGYVPCKNCNP